MLLFGCRWRSPPSPADLALGRPCLDRPHFDQRYHPRRHHHPVALYNPGLVTSIVLFLPFTIFALALGVERGTLTGGDVGLIMLYGVLLHRRSPRCSGSPSCSSAAAI